MNYTVQYFIDKFEAIPEERWATGKLFTDDGRRCAQGHCMSYWDATKTDERDIVGSEANELVKILGGHFAHKGLRVALINNGYDPLYQQPTPKQRILAALYDIKNMQSRGEGGVDTWDEDDERVKTNYPDLTKSLAVLPVSETSDVINQPVKI